MYRNGVRHAFGGARVSIYCLQSTAQHEAPDPARTKLLLRYATCRSCCHHGLAII